MRRFRVMVVAPAAAVAALAGTATAADRVECRSDEPFPARVHESRFDSEHGPARLSARLSGTGTASCSNGLTNAPLQIEQSLALIEHHGNRGPCFEPHADINTTGRVRGRSELTLAISAPDGDTRRLAFHGRADGTLQVDDQDPTHCLLDLDVRGQAANGAGLTLQLTGIIDRATEALVSTSLSKMRWQNLPVGG